MTSIGLCMIVKNEAGVIRRCIESTRPLVDYVLIVDTGSADGTQSVVEEFLRDSGCPGEVVQEPWRDFAFNRSDALRRLRARTDVDYSLMLDADQTIVTEPDFVPETFKQNLDCEVYDVRIKRGGSEYFLPLLVSNRIDVSYKAVLHEYCKLPNGVSRAVAAGFFIQEVGGGARSRNPQKYRDDAALLEKALSTETDPFHIARYKFYLAQSYRDCDEKSRALSNYLERAQLGFWDEEVFLSLLYAARLKEAMGHPDADVFDAYLNAYEACPRRAEALHGALRFCRIRGNNQRGYLLGKQALEARCPDKALFVERWIYDYGILDEFSVVAYWTGHYWESLDACQKILYEDKIPQADRDRVSNNAKFAHEKLGSPPFSGRGGDASYAARTRTHPDGFGGSREPQYKAPNLGTLGAESLIDQHKLVPQRLLRSRVNGLPRVLLAILAKQQEPELPLYLECIEALDYPKASIVLYIRTNNNTDRTERILREWVERVRHLYAAVEFDASDVADRVEKFSKHEWNATRFKVLGHMRDISLRKTLEHDCDFYFVADVDNFIRRCTLRELVALNLPVVAPLLRSILPSAFYSNYHAEIDQNGYYKSCDQYQWILNRHVRGVFEMPVVHCTYLVRTDVARKLAYQDATDRHEYVIFSDSARKAGIPQYLDNRQVYGYITFAEGDLHVSNGIERARELLWSDLQERSEGDADVCDMGPVGVSFRGANEATG